MTTDHFHDSERRFIAPYHWGGLEGWLVRISWYPDGTYESRKWHGKLFSFSKYDGQDAALDAAREYRDHWIEEHKDQRYVRTAGAPFTPKLLKNNTSGIVGVSRSGRIGKSGKLETCWQTTFTTPEDKIKSRKFSVDKYGEVTALRMAIETRRAAIIAVLESREIPEDDMAYSLIDFYDDILANLMDYRDQSSDPSVVEIVRNQEITATTKLEQIQARVGQQRFRRQVLENFDFRCAVTGSSFLVRASHIKPWRVCSNEERLNPMNGLALSPVYDAAFDLGLITFRPDGFIMLSPKFKPGAADLWIAGDEQIKSLTAEHHVFLDWHRKNVFERSDG